jgi:hypothetical protein
MDYIGECPYCNQRSMKDGDARLSCGCFQAVRYRKILGALDKQSEEAAPMREIDEGVMAVLRECAHQVCALKIDKITANLRDGTTVSIGGKVSRSARLKMEEKVGEQKNPGLAGRVGFTGEPRSASSGRPGGPGKS